MILAMEWVDKGYLDSLMLFFGMIMFCSLFTEAKRTFILSVMACLFCLAVKMLISYRMPL